MAGAAEPNKPGQNAERRKRIVLRILLWLVVIAVFVFRFYSYQEEWNHQKEKGYEVGAAFREDLLKNRLDAAYESTTAGFKERWSREDLEEQVAEIVPNGVTDYIIDKGWSITAGFLSKFFRGHMKSEYPIPFRGKDGKQRELQLTIVEEDGVLKVDQLEVIEDGEEE